jgi:DNA-directed RNA polymerase
MPTIADQKNWEKDMTALGVARFRAQQENAKKGERFTDTSAGGRLLRVYLSQVGAAISDEVNNPRRRNMYLKLLKGIDFDKLAMFTLYRVIECVYKPGTVQRVAASIGKMVEDELRFSKFEIELPEYYNAVQRDLDNRHSTSYTHRHRVLVKKMNDKEVEWTTWTNETHVGVGLVLLGAAEAASDLIKRGKKDGNTTIEPSDEVLEWINNHDDSIEIMLPDRMPCIVQPVEWTDWKDGGFHTRRLNNLTPLVKTRSGQQRDTQAPLLDTVAMPAILNSVNAMQNTTWTVNQPILEVVQQVWKRGLEIGMPRSVPYEIPSAPIPEGKKPGDLVGPAKVRFDDWKAEARVLHGLEGERKAGLMSVVRAMRMADRLKPMELLWLVYQLDFRSRTYTTTNGVSPQGSDVSKAMLHFGEGTVLGERGLYWLKVHGANKYGYDKDDYDGRVAWVDGRTEQLIAAGTDPLANTDVWKGADKPYQFLAFCVEFASASLHPGGAKHFVSRLPVALDGSCNGLQHFSAMLRDEVGGRSVNLVPSARPSDIYQDVANVATEKLLSIVTDPSHPEYALAANWLGVFKKHTDGKMNRKLAKKPVMTLPYGSTLQTCTQTVHGWYLDLKDEYLPKGTAFQHSVFLSRVMWESIGEVVIAARAAMKWLQQCARKLAKHNEPIIYTTPVGFPMVQFSPLMDTKRIHAQIGGSIKVQVRKELPGVDTYGAANGSSPNLVHSVDAAHMHMVVEQGAKEGMTHFAMIHDDFGTHACYIDRWHAIIREQFVRLHTEHDILREFRDQQEERTGIALPDLPAVGTLDLSGVLKSDFFFG